MTVSIVDCCRLVGDFRAGVTRRIFLRNSGARNSERNVGESTIATPGSGAWRWLFGGVFRSRHPRVSFALFFLFRALLLCPNVEHLQRRLSTHSSHPSHTKSPAKATLLPPARILSSNVRSFNHDEPDVSLIPCTISCVEKPTRGFTARFLDRDREFLWKIEDLGDFEAKDIYVSTADGRLLIEICLDGWPRTFDRYGLAGFPRRLRESIDGEASTLEERWRTYVRARG